MPNLLPSLSPLHHITVSTSPDAPYTSTLHRQPRLQHQDQLRLLPREWCALCIVRPPCQHSNGECITQPVTCLVTAAGGISKMKAAKRGGRTGPTDRQRPLLKDLGISEAEINNIKTSGEASTMIECGTAPIPALCKLPSASRSSLR